MNRKRFTLYRDQRDLLIFGYVRQMSVEKEIPTDIKQLLVFVTFANSEDFFDHKSLMDMPQVWSPSCPNIINAIGTTAVPIGFVFKHRSTDRITWKFKLTHITGNLDKVYFLLVDLDGGKLGSFTPCLQIDWLRSIMVSIEENDADDYQRPATTIVELTADMSKRTFMYEDSTGIGTVSCKHSVDFALQIGFQCPKNGVTIELIEN